MAPLSSGSSSPREQQDMITAALDRGELTKSKIDRDFTKFLDIKHEFHGHFINKFRDFAEESDYTWETLRDSPSAREECVQSFLDEYGIEFWGTARNRKKYLMRDSLENPEQLFTYPERAADLKRTLVILLERKAWGTTKHRQLQSKPSTAPKQTATPTSSQALASDHSAIKTLSQKAKRKVTESDDVPDEATKTRLNPVAKRRITELTTSPALPQPNFCVQTDNSYQSETYFLISASSKSDLAPVWIRYRDFLGASAFLEHMGEQCGLQEWDPNAQLAAEGYGNQRFVASVKFGWSADEILVRGGNDEDWSIAAQEVQRAWIAKRFGMTMIQIFKIHVRLHVKD